MTGDQPRVAIITGGASGIGFAVADLFSANGLNAVIVGRDMPRGETAAARLQRTLFLRGDVRVAADCERIILQTLDRLGRIDVLINNAGVIYRNRTVEQTCEEEWDHTFDTSVKGAFLMCRSAMPALRRWQGNIVNVASYAGLVGYAGAAAYSAAKAALVNLTRTMALDHAAEGVRINCVCPGSVGTEMLFKAWKHLGEPDEIRKQFELKHPLGRIAAPEEIARAIYFLSSTSASFITGVALPVDGGITAG